MMNVQSAIAKLEKQAWDLHKRLGEAYENTVDQYRDMERLGVMGKKLRMLHAARAVLNELDRDSE